MKIKDKKKKIKKFLKKKKSEILNKLYLASQANVEILDAAAGGAINERCTCCNEP